MAYIEVDHKKLAEAANGIDRYVDKLKSNMSSIDNTMNGLKTGWDGADYNQLMKEWNEINGTGSTTAKYISTLQAYSGTLQEARKKYIDAQAKAVNRARQYCK